MFFLVKYVPKYTGFKNFFYASKFVLCAEVFLILIGIYFLKMAALPSCFLAKT